MTQNPNKSKVKRKFLPKHGTNDSQWQLPEFKSGIRDSLSSHVSSVNFLCTSRQMQEWHHISCHKHYVPYLFNSLHTRQRCILYIT